MKTCSLHKRSRRKGSNRCNALRTSSYAFFGEIRYYQFTAVDIRTRMSFRYLYDEKTHDNTIDFIKRMIAYFPFRVHCIQTATVGSACGNNGAEFTYRKHFFETEHPLDIFCKKEYIKRGYSPAASPWYCRRHAQRWCRRKYA